MRWSTSSSSCCRAACISHFHHKLGMLLLNLHVLLLLLLLTFTGLTGLSCLLLIRGLVWACIGMLRKLCWRGWEGLQQPPHVQQHAADAATACACAQHC